MYIFHVASELNPIAKVGGLADVVYGLSKELVRSGHQVEILLPKYDVLDYNLLKNLKVEFRELWSYEGPYRFNNTFWSAEVENLHLVLMEPHHPLYYFTRGSIYGCLDDNDRFIYFARTALEYLYKSGKRPDIVHLHDWPTALIPVLYKEMYIPLGLHLGGTVFTIHNLEHQGRCAPFNLTKAGLRGEDFLSRDKMQDPYLRDNLNLLKGGIVYADAVTTVSPTYEKEIKTPSGGCGLDNVLTTFSSKLKGILNGIDEDFWNPKTDPHLVKNFDTRAFTSLEDVLEAKEFNRQHLRKQLGLKQHKAPLVVAISRLVPQKGPELIRRCILRTLEKGGQFILLGTSPNPETYLPFLKIKKEHPLADELILYFEKEETLAHRLFAAADMIVVPSLFEPCGLTQMIALRYGTVPIVRSTGGLADTVFDIETSKKPLQERNGFTFDFPDATGVDWALDRALDYWKKEKTKWHQLMKQGMSYDYSWSKEGGEYLNIYTKIMSGQWPS